MAGHPQHLLQEQPILRAFDPLSDHWLRLPSPTFPPYQYSHSCFLCVDGFFLITAPNFNYSKILKRAWRFTSPLQFSRINPLLGVFESGSLLPNFIVVSGVRCIWNLVDIEDRLAVGIYDPDSDSWQLGPPLPADSQSLSSALFKDESFYKGRVCAYPALPEHWVCQRKLKIQHKCGRWEARMGQLLGKKYITLAYLIARLKLQGHYVTK